MIATGRISRILTLALLLGAASNARAADEGAWSVSKSSGEVWRTTTGLQPVSLGREEVLKPGDSIRTGRNGRVLLVRGEETILVSPNSVIGLPLERKEGLATTIVQQAGSILLEVEKRNVRHFEVETPYLAAVVKGTQFRVSVNATSTSVNVLRGQVQVADFRSGQIAQVMPGQHATAFAKGNSGLSLGGSGTFSPIERGQPRAPTVDRVPVPKSGLTAPRHAANGLPVRALSQGNGATRAGLGASLQRNSVAAAPRHSATRISSALGEVRLNIHRVTNGLARGATPAHGATRSAGSRDTVWSSANSRSANAFGNGSNNSNDASNGNANGAMAGANSAASGAAGALVAAASAGNGNGNNANSGNNGNNGNNGNGNANANANGNGANGGGNGSNGNGHGRGLR